MILEYILKLHLQDIIDIVSATDNLGYYSIKINFLTFFHSYPDVGNKVLRDAIESLSACNQDIVKAQQILLEFDEYKKTISKLDYHYVKTNVHARFFGLPECPDLHRTIFPKNVDLGCFLKVTGTVIRVTQAKMLEYQRKYVCVKCKFENCVKADFENRYILKAPKKCWNDNPKCKCTAFTQVNMVSREHCKDYQEIKIQEQVNKSSIATIPGSVRVVLENDLVDCCKPGDDVIISGTVRRRWRPCVQMKNTEVELLLQANYIEVCNTQRSQVLSSAPDVKECFDKYWAKYEACPLKGRDQILMGVCPQVYGLKLVKLAILLTVITGSNHQVDADSKSSEEEHITRVRGQCHLLLVGDPGTGKSQLLRAGLDLTARSVFTSGCGSTRAGLTCAALKEEGEWQLEAGALMLADGGVCCIDEVSQLREHDRAAIHEAMEQQTISVAKAGIVCKLSTRCAIIAACNPKGHYDTELPLSVNVSLGTPLLSRFDLIFILLDSKNEKWDKLVSSYILFERAITKQPKRLWTTEMLQMYISVVGPRCTEMTMKANKILQSYYMLQRKSEHRDASRTTVRMLDSLVRLSQAHCRLMYRKTILPMDAITAISLVDLSMQDFTLKDTVDALHSTFRKYPDFDYLCLAKKLLTKLHLNQIWQSEVLFYGQLLQVDSATLEADIDSGNPKLFAKFDDVTDDTVELPATIITSTYFKAKTDDDLDFHEEKENICDESKSKLIALLSKHANLNKNVRKLPVMKKKIKRKMKEVTVDTTVVKNKIAKITKKYKKSHSDQDSEHDDSESETEILKGVPSVNDGYGDLGVDFHFTCSVKPDNLMSSTPKDVSSPIKCNKSDETTSDGINKDFNKSSSIQFEINNVNKSCHNNTNADNPATSKTMNKLKQFSFNKTHEFDKYEEKPFLDKSPDKTLQKLDQTIGNSFHTPKQEPPTQSSQISIFENSDSDIDLDI